MEFAIGLLCIGIGFGHPKIGAMACMVIVCGIAVYRIRNWEPK